MGGSVVTPEYGVPDPAYPTAQGEVVGGLDPVAEPLWRGPWWEITVRVAAAVFLVVVVALSAWHTLAYPRWTDDQGALFRDAANGRLVRLDPERYTDWDHAPDSVELRGARGFVRWQTTEGSYQTSLPDDIDVEAAVRAQPYVAAHPESVTYGRVHPDLPGWVRWVTPVAYVVVIAALVAGPQPRLLTKWAWFFTLRPPLALIGYLLLSGSLVRTSPHPPGRRVNGWVVWGVAAVLGIGLALADVDVSGSLTPAPDTSGSYVPPTPSPSPG